MSFLEVLRSKSSDTSQANEFQLFCLTVCQIIFIFIGVMYCIPIPSVGSEQAHCSRRLPGRTKKMPQAQLETSEP